MKSSWGVGTLLLSWTAWETGAWKGNWEGPGHSGGGGSPGVANFLWGREVKHHSKRHVGSPGVQGKPPGCMDTVQVNGGAGVEILCQRVSGHGHQWHVLLIPLFLVGHILIVLWTRVSQPIHQTYHIPNMVTISTSAASNRASCTPDISCPPTGGTVCLPQLSRC